MCADNSQEAKGSSGIIADARIRVRGIFGIEIEADDGETFGYQRGQRTTVKFTARLQRDGNLALKTEVIDAGYGQLRVRVVSYSSAGKVLVDSTPLPTALPLRSFSWQCTGPTLSVRASAPFPV